MNLRRKNIKYPTNEEQIKNMIENFKVSARLFVSLYTSEPFTRVKKKTKQISPIAQKDLE